MDLITRTVKEIGYDAGLLFDDLERFVMYMATYWDHRRSEKCTDRYIREWAQVFAKGLEYEKSDKYGQHVLRIIDAQMGLKEEDLKCPKR